MKDGLNPEKDLNIKPINQGKVPDMVPDVGVLDHKAIAKQRWKDLEAEEMRTVKGKFIYHECPGGFLEYTFRKFKSVPMKTYSFHDGMTYEIPLAVARHLNNNVSYPVHAFKQDEGGKPVSGVHEMIRRTSFQAIEFF